MLPIPVLDALERRFLETGSPPRDLTWFDIFPTGLARDRAVSPRWGCLKRVISGWYTLHPRLREMVLAETGRWLLLSPGHAGVLVSGQRGWTSAAHRDGP